MGGRGAVLPAVALWFGLLCGVRNPGSAAFAAFGALGFGWLAWRAPDRTGTAALVVALVLGGCARGGAHEAAIDHARSSLTHDGLYHVAARVTEPPLRASGEPAAVVRIVAATPRLPPDLRARLRLPAGAAIEWGDRIEALIRIEAPSALRNPGGYDAAEAAAAAGIAWVGRALWVERVPGAPLEGWPRASFARWRRAIEQRLATALDAPARELVIPLVLGDRTALSSDSNAALRASGLIHLLALSGLHIVWMAVIARGLLASLGGGVRSRACAGTLCALGYASLAGPIPSLVRAAAVEVLAAMAKFTGRALDPLQALAVAAIALLSWSPGWCSDLGFQLSCAATLGLVSLGPALGGFAPRARLLISGVTPTLSAQITALPLLLERMHAFSWVGLVTNLLAVPISGLLLAAAWLAALADLALPGSGRVLFQSTEALALAFRAVTEAGSRCPGALIPAGHGPALPALAAIGACLLVAAVPRARAIDARLALRSGAQTLAIGLGALATSLAILLVIVTAPLAPPAGTLWLVALDVGQGDALALGFEDGWWFVDTGPRTRNFDAGEAILLPFARWAGLRGIGTLVITHDDGDHRGGVKALLRSLHAGRVLVPPPYSRIPGPGVRVGGSRAIARGDTLRRSPLVRVLWPPAPAVAAAAPPGSPAIDSDNRACIALEIDLAGHRVELLADVDSTVERCLGIAEHPSLLKVAHHGSGSSSGAVFLAGVRPREAFLSCGRRNPFGHPHPGALARLGAAGTLLHRTDLEGALWFEIDRSGVRRIRWREGIPAQKGAANPSRLPGAAAPREP